MPNEPGPAHFAKFCAEILPGMLEAREVAALDVALVAEDISMRAGSGDGSCIRRPSCGYLRRILIGMRVSSFLAIGSELPLAMLAIFIVRHDCECLRICRWVPCRVAMVFL
jgi:hypothetical protein